MSTQPDHKGDHIHPLARPFLWLEAKWLKSMMVYILGVVAVLLAAIDFFHQRYEYVDYAKATGFYAWWGFGSFVLAVMGGWFIVRHFLGREEDYWDKDAGDD